MGKLCSVSVKRKVKGARWQEGVRAKNKKRNSACSLFNRGEGDEDNEQNHWAMGAGTARTYLLTHTYSYIYTQLFTLQRTCFATWNPAVTACINIMHRNGGFQRWKPLRSPAVRWHSRNLSSSEVCARGIDRSTGKLWSLFVLFWCAVFLKHGFWLSNRIKVPQLAFWLRNLSNCSNLK